MNPISTALKRPLLGAHMSIAGGVDKAILQGQSIGCETIQIFTKSSRQWFAHPYEQEEIKNFRRLKEEHQIIVIAHDSYLLNIGSSNELLRQKSMKALIDELERCEVLGIPYLIVHPGSHTGSGEETGIRAIAQSLNQIHQTLPGIKTKIALEITAGQGTNLGYHFSQIRSMIEQTKETDRLKVCFDTEHAFAAGYDLRTKELYEKTFDEFDNEIGLENLVAFHLNDSKKEFGSRVDRHEHIGQGFLGKEAFRLLINDSRFWGKIACLETPKGPDLKEDVENLKFLKSLLKN